MPLSVALRMSRGFQRWMEQLFEKSSNDPGMKGSFIPNLPLPPGAYRNYE